MLAGKSHWNRWRREVAEQLLRLGPDGGRRLHAIVRADFLQQLPRYSSSYQRAAVGVLKGRLAKADPAAEIESLRQTIRDVAAAADLSKEMIERKSDPALARLEALLVVTPAEVLATDPKLSEGRAALLALADWAERAATLLPEKDRAKLAPLPGRAETAAELDAADEPVALARPSQEHARRPEANRPGAVRAALDAAVRVSLVAAHCATGLGCGRV